MSAEGSRDLHDLPLQYHWVLLRGKEDLVQIQPLNEEASVAELTLSYHERFPVEPDSAMETNRVDIGVFVSNSEHISAPAFISTYFLDNEYRKYDRQKRLQILDYTHGSKRNNYVDPIIEPAKNWRDEFRYDDHGRLSGWTRKSGDEIHEFTSRGNLIVSKNDRGRPLLVKQVRYHLDFEGGTEKRPTLRMEFSPENYKSPLTHRAP